MDLGDILVVVGILFAVLDFFIPYDNRATGYRRVGGALLNLGVICIGIGILVQGTKVGSGT